MVRVSSVKLNEISKFWALNNARAPKCIWRPGSARTRWGSYSAPPGPLAVMGQRREGHGEEGEGKGKETGKGEGKGKGKTGDGEGEKGDGKGM